MIVRKIKPYELKRTNELFAVAFEYEVDNTKTAKEVYEEATNNSQSREDIYWQERWAAFKDDDETMMSFFVAKPYPVHFDNHHCTMTGIGGVATLPQYRRHGGIRACFEASLPAMYEDGIEFSYLYPFSTAYYRKFGYELCCERISYQIKLNMIKAFPVEGSCYLVEQDNLMLEDIKSIYEVWQNKYNMMIVNEEYEYAWIKQSNPAKNQEFTYVYKDKDGIPKGYMTFSKVDEATGRNLRCKRFFYTELEGFKGLMNLLLSCSSDHQYVTFELPTDQFITPLLPEWSMGAVKSERIPCGMVRVINAKKVLQLATYKGDGSLKIKLNDSFIPQNNATFLVRFEKDTAIDVISTEEPADITININDFSRLIVGACETAEIEFMENVHTNTSLEELAKVFYKKPTLIAEYF